MQGLLKCKEDDLKGIHAKKDSCGCIWSLCNFPVTAFV